MPSLSSCLCQAYMAEFRAATYPRTRWLQLREWFTSLLIGRKVGRMSKVIFINIQSIYSRAAYSVTALYPFGELSLQGTSFRSCASIFIFPFFFAKCAILNIHLNYTQTIHSPLLYNKLISRREKKIVVTEVKKKRVKRKSRARIECMENEILAWTILCTERLYKCIARERQDKSQHDVSLGTSLLRVLARFFSRSSMLLLLAGSS